MIERIDDKTVRIKLENNWYFLDCPKETNLIVFENTFIRGFTEGLKH